MSFSVPRTHAAAGTQASEAMHRQAPMLYTIMAIATVQNARQRAPIATHAAVNKTSPTPRTPSSLAT